MAGAVLEIAAPEMSVVLQMADHGFDGGAVPKLGTFGRR